METQYFTASLFYFRSSDWGKIGPYAHSPCNFLNLTEIFLHRKDYQIQKIGAKSCSKEGVHAEKWLCHELYDFDLKSLFLGLCEPVPL